MVSLATMKVPMMNSEVLTDKQAHKSSSLAPSNGPHRRNRRTKRQDGIASSENWIYITNLIAGR